MTIEGHRALGEFTRVEPKGKTDRQLLIANLKQAEAVHACLEEHRDVFNRFVGEQRLGNLDATERRLKLQEDLQELKGAVTEDRHKIEKITLALGVEKPAPGQKKPRGHGLATWGLWKVIGVLGGSISFVVFAYQFAAAVGPDLFHDIHVFMMGLKP